MSLRVQRSNHVPQSYLCETHFFNIMGYLNLASNFSLDDLLLTVIMNMVNCKQQEIIKYKIKDMTYIYHKDMVGKGLESLPTQN